MAENTNNDSSVQVDEKMIIDDIQKALKFEFTRDILIKPLPVEYVEKEITEPVATGKKDKDGVDKYDTKTESYEWCTDQPGDPARPGTFRHG